MLGFVHGGPKKYKLKHSRIESYVERRARDFEER